MEMKKCTKCGMEKPATVEWFVKQKTGKNGLKATCKECDKEYRKNNQERMKEYKEKNKEILKVKNKEYRNRNQERISKWNNENKEWRKEYKKNNPEKIRILKQKRRALQNNLPSTLTLKQWQSTKNHFNHECVYCGKQFKNLHQDHFWPLSRGGGYIKLNIIPACFHCNCSKGNKPFEEWYPTHESYSPEREAKIYRYFEHLALENGGWGRQRHDLGTVTIEVRI